MTVTGTPTDYDVFPLDPYDVHMPTSKWYFRLLTHSQILAWQISVFQQCYLIIGKMEWIALMIYQYTSLITENCDI